MKDEIVIPCYIPTTTTTYLLSYTQHTTHGGMTNSSVH